MKGRGETQKKTPTNDTLVEMLQVRRGEQGQGFLVRAPGERERERRCQSNKLSSSRKADITKSSIRKLKMES